MNASSRIAILAHSTNPRGGVAHAMALAEALTALGHETVLHAPDASGRGFARIPRCTHVALPVAPAPRDIAAMVEQRAAEYRDWFSQPGNRRFDVFHAQDSISATALRRLQEDGLIGGFARTVHHIDHFDDPRLMALQRDAITAASAHFVVSALWQDVLARDWGIVACNVGNGVDPRRFSSQPDGRDDALRKRLGLGSGPVLLAVGGIEERKNTLGILAGFLRLREQYSNAQLVIAGGASLLDHDQYRERFAQRMAEATLPPDAVVTTGPVADADMPALYRLADALAFPSLREGFGLVVLEAMASGLPCVVSRRAPFTEYLGSDDAAWCDPADAGSIATAMATALDPDHRNTLIHNGLAVIARHGWDRTAQAHLPGYAALLEAAYA